MKPRQILINKNSVPSGGFRFLERGMKEPVWIRAPSWIQLLDKVKDYRRTMNLPIGLDFEHEVETQLCETMPPCVCSYCDKTQKRRAAQIARPKWEKYLEATRAVIEVLKDGIAPHTEAESHAAVCAKCPFNQMPEGCTACNASELVNLLSPLALRPTVHDNRLRGCILCGCALKAKVHLKAETVNRLAAPYLDVLPDFCWIRSSGATETTAEP